MQPTQTSGSKTKVALTWIAVVASMVAIYAFWTWWFGRRPSSGSDESGPGIVFSVVMGFLGMIFLVGGIGAYAATIFTNCLTFDFRRPVWNEVKVKIFFANILVPLGFALGLGFLLSALVSPALIAAGVNRGFANIGSVMGMIFVVQLVQLWILIWGPLEKRLITKRSSALGVTAQQLQGAFTVGISNPEKSSFKKFGLIEEDVGALWVGPEQLIYWGDREQFGLSREQITRIERRQDTGSTSMLGGVAHVILHVKQSDGSTRQIRLHNEGLLTMGQKRSAMEQLAQAIAQWHGDAEPASVVAQA